MVAEPTLSGGKPSLSVGMMDESGFWFGVSGMKRSLFRRGSGSTQPAYRSPRVRHLATPSKPRCAGVGLIGFAIASLLLQAPAAPAQTRIADGSRIPSKYRVADLKALENAFVALADHVRPSVVAIRSYLANDSEGGRRRQVLRPVSQGTGFVIARDGYIATNRHVLEDANVFTVILHNGQKLDAEVIQTDLRSDLAVIKIDANGLTPVRFGDLADVRVNQWTFAVGNPFGLANNDGVNSVTYGVVSALGREMTNRLADFSELQYYGNMIETSAAINPGGSGGPLFNIDGEMIGVVTAIETSSGVSEGAGFAIPVTRNTRRILDTLKAGKEVHYGFLGVTVKDVTLPTSRRVADSGRFRGAQLSEITIKGGPADKAGLRPNDIIVEFDGTTVEDFDHLVRLVGFTPVGGRVPLTYLRNGERRTTSVVLGDRLEMLRKEAESN